MNISDKALACLKLLEHFKPVPYNDGGEDGKLNTIGYGHYIRPRESFTVVTENEASVMLEYDCAAKEGCVDTAIVPDPIPQEHFDAMVMLAFNIGCKGFAKSTLVTMYNNGDIKGALTQFRRWNKDRVNGVLVPVRGLSKRRYAEQLIWAGNYEEAMKIAAASDWEYNEALVQG